MGNYDLHSVLDLDKVFQSRISKAQTIQEKKMGKFDLTKIKKNWGGG